MISAYSSLKSSDKELTQYRRPVCVGPSGNTWPKWPPQFEHTISTLIIPCDVSFNSLTFSFSALSKEGQPQWELNFEDESNNSVEHPAQTYTPFSKC